MSFIDKLYKRENYTIQKSINIEYKLYEGIKKLADYKYDAKISELVNVCIEDLIERNNIIYYPKPQGEILEYRSIMIRKDNLDKLKEINNKTGISVTRLINLAIKQFLEDIDKLQ